MSVMDQPSAPADGHMMVLYAAPSVCAAAELLSQVPPAPRHSDAVTLELSEQEPAWR
jgi:hypothetical protein